MKENRLDQSTRAASMISIGMERMVRTYPFHANLIGFGRIVEDLSIETMAVTVRDGTVTFLYNPDFVCRCTLQELTGVLHHEVNHVLFRHIFVDPEYYPDRRARIIAEEVTVNEWVSEPLPGQPLVLAQFPELPPREDTDTRYRKLVQKRQPCVPKKAVPGRKNGTSSPETLADSPESVRCPRPLDDHDIWAEIRKERAIGRVIVNVAINHSRNSLSPEQWRSIPGELRNQIDRACRGELPGHDVEKIERSQRLNRVNKWERILRQYIRRALEVRPVFNRPPRRFPELIGVVPGRSRSPKKAKVMAVIDTSGSISSRAIEQICFELHCMSRTHDVSVVECDAKIHATYAYAGLIRTVKGRGGTDLRPPFDTAFLRTIRPDVIIYFTDGNGQAPSEPPRVPVIWCLTGSGRQPAKWGRTVLMQT